MDMTEYPSGSEDNGARVTMEDVGESEEDDDMEEESDEEVDDAGASADNAEKKVYLPGGSMQQDEELVCDDSAYVMYHQAQTGAPCLSFDILRDPLGQARDEYPLTCYIVAGTQAEHSHANNIIVMKMSNLKKTSKEPEKNEEKESESESEDEDDLPELEAAMIQHTGSVNRVRATSFNDKTIAASWSENGKVCIWDLSRPLNAVNDSQVMAAYTRNQESPAALFSFRHQVEGYAMDWSKNTIGRLATGDCNKNIHIWNPSEAGSWNVDQRPYSSHTASVEDIQWSPNEGNVFASCSVDKSIKVWDARASPAKACMLTTNDAHDSDVNVISWNRTEPFILSGGDDGMVKVWDLRQFQKGKPVAIFKHHGAPVTSVEWHPIDSTVFASSGADDQVTLWDLAVERDPESAGGSAEPEVPPQLLFIHQGQKDVKEIHWHPQLAGVIISTALSGFNIFRTISV